MFKEFFVIFIASPETREFLVDIYTTIVHPMIGSILGFFIARNARGQRSLSLSTLSRGMFVGVLAAAILFTLWHNKDPMMTFIWSIFIGCFGDIIFEKIESSKKGVIDAGAEWMKKKVKDRTGIEIKDSEPEKEIEPEKEEKSFMDKILDNKEPDNDEPEDWGLY